MKSNFLKSLDATVEAVAALEVLFTALPYPVLFDIYDPKEIGDLRLIQLFWRGPEDEWDKRQEQAKIIARAWGGKWERRDDGTWEGVRPSDAVGCCRAGQKLILHHVEMKRVGNAIEL